MKKSRIHEILKSYIKTKDLTALCREMKRLGITKRADIYSAFKGNYTYRYLYSKCVPVGRICFSDLKHDLDAKKEPVTECYFNFIQEMKLNKDAGSYKKVLIEGNTHIYWASPIYGHADYNKSIWRENTQKNREKMRVINAFLSK